MNFSFSDKLDDKNVIIIPLFKNDKTYHKDFNINFPMTEKINVIGNNSHPFFKWARENYGKAAIPKWNFHKIIIGKDGKVADTFSSITKPSSKRFINSIDKIIKN